MPADERLKCFLLGVEVGDALEDLQEQTEDLVEQAAVVSDQFQTLSLPSCLKNTAGDLVDMLVGPASLDCGWESPGIGVLSQLRNGVVKPAEVAQIRKRVDEITAHFARTANATALGRSMIASKHSYPYDDLMYAAREAHDAGDEYAETVAEDNARKAFERGAIRKDELVDVLDRLGASHG